MHQPEPAARATRRGLAARLAALLLLFSLGPLAVFNIRGYLHSRDLLVTQGLRDVRNVAELQAAQIGQAVEERRELVRFLLQDDPRLRALLRDRSPARGAALERALTRKLAASHLLQGLVLFDRLGRRVAACGQGAQAELDRPVKVSYGHSECSPMVLSLAGEAGRDRIVLAAPIHDDRGRLLGVGHALLRLPLRGLLVSTRNRRLPGAELALIDAEGRVLCCSCSEPPCTKTLAGRAGIVGGKSGPRMMAAGAPVGRAGWTVAAQQPLALASRPLERLGRQALLGAAALAMLLLGVCYLTARTVTGPLRSLSLSAGRIAAGARGESVPVRGPAELADLAKSFNVMSQALARSEHSLEDRIRQRTEALESSRAFSDTLLRSIDQPLILLDRERRIVRVNEAAPHGARLVGTLCRELLCGTEQGCGACPVRTALASGRPQSAEMALRIEGGHEICRVECYPVTGKTGETEQFLLTYRIVTDERRQQAQLVHQEKLAALGLLAAGMAHEIGNPLASISAQIQNARLHPQEVEQTLRVVGEQVRRIDGLLRELTHFARRRRDEPTVISVERVIEDAVRLIEHDPRCRQIRIERRLAPNLPGLHTREDLLLQVLLNLGINALDAAPVGGCVTFEAARDNGQVVIRVADDGPGVPPAHRERIFEPFFTTKPIGRGTGLGLFVNRRIIDDLGGTLELEHAGPGGAVFAVRLPLDRA